jgi:hypothetical protein
MEIWRYFSLAAIQKGWVIYEEDFGLDSDSGAADADSAE